MKRIAIIGGGISGLTVLHYLKQRLNDNAEITLYECEKQVGGTVCTQKKGDCVFEWGPNAFLDNQPSTLQLIEELNLTDQLIEASESSSRRYIQMKGQLYAVPMDPLSFFQTPLISRKDKWSLIQGLFKKNVSTDCSIYDYVSKRFSKGIAESLVDPMISGICAGDIKRLHMVAFPKFKDRWGKKTRMRSLTGGMGQVIEALYKRYQSSIQTNVKVSLNQINADITVIATGAFAASLLIQEINPTLSDALKQIPYAPVAVVGLCFSRRDFKKRQADGFGYLIPSREHKDILGVLIESNIFPNRAAPEHVMLRVMLGGRHHRDPTHKAPQEIINMALGEIKAVYGLKEQPLEAFIKVWPQAIPQYEMNYPLLRQSIAHESAKTPGLYLCANYLDGVSFNDCIHNAKSLAATISA